MTDQRPISSNDTGRRGRRLFLRLLLALPALVVAGRLPSARADERMQRYICVAADCPGYIYDPAKGDPDSGIPPGTWPR